MKTLKLKPILQSVPLHVVIIGVTIAWLLPSLGLFVTSFRLPGDVVQSGWWTVFQTPFDFPQYTLQNFIAGLPSDLFKFDDGRLVVEFIGGTRAEQPTQYRLASPIYHVDADTPPHFLFHGRWDGLVPVDHATDFHAELLAQGVESELYLQHFRGHFTSFLIRGHAIETGIAFLDRQLLDD